MADPRDYRGYRGITAIPITVQGSTADEADMQLNVVIEKLYKFILQINLELLPASKIQTRVVMSTYFLYSIIPTKTLNTFLEGFMQQDNTKRIQIILTVSTRNYLLHGSASNVVKTGRSVDGNRSKLTPCRSETP
jgi:hypothetical protein